MPSMNQVILMGHLGKGAETTYTPSGTSVTKFSLATSRRYKRDNDTEWTEITHWHNVIAWRCHEKLIPYLTKGSLVMVVGRVETRSYEKDGVARWVTEIIAERVNFLRHEGLSAGTINDGTAIELAEQQGAPHRQAAAAQQPPRRSAPEPPPSYDDSVPF